MPNITVTRALTEISVLDSRITNAIATFHPLAMTRGRADRKSVVGSNETFESVSKSIIADYASINSLMERREKLRTLVAVSNTTTFVTVAGETMTVQQAIERKIRMKYTLSLVHHMVTSANAVNRSVESSKQTLDKQIEEAVAAIYGGKGEVTKESYDLIAAPRLREHEPAILDPLNLSTEIEKLQKQLNDFSLAVDYALSESNAVTMIAID